MAQEPNYYLIDSVAIPEVFQKVVEAKRLLETGEAATVADAAQMCDISRSAFYKYRDHVSSFQNLMAGRALIYRFVLQNAPGTLLSILNIFAQYGANIRAISQSVPINGCATAVITAETDGLRGSLEELICALKTAPGVIRTEILAG